jgi:hypothetical protein
MLTDAGYAPDDTLPVNLRFDVLEIPGKEELSAILKDHRVQRDGSSILIGMGGAPLEPLPSGNSI